MMKKIIFLFIASLSLQFSLTAQADKKIASSKGYTFTPIYDLACTPVKSQDKTGTCWSFSTISLLESEVLRTQETPQDLSEMYAVRHTYLKKAENYLRYHGKTNFSEGSLCHDVLNALEETGAMPESAYPGKMDAEKGHDHSQLVNELRDYLDLFIEKETVPANWRKGYNIIMDKYMGKVPSFFTYNGKKHTASSYAHALRLKADDFISVASFTHHPYKTEFVLEVPDNFSNGKYLNVHINTLTKMVDKALAQGFTVGWDCDVSELGFSPKRGLAILPENMEALTKEEMNERFRNAHAQMKVTPEMRQAEFDSYSLTDDHLMHIVGMAKDQNGTLYYKVKNSWGKKGDYDGYIYASRAYFMMNTISITLPKIAIPKELSALQTTKSKGSKTKGTLNATKIKNRDTFKQKNKQ